MWLVCACARARARARARACACAGMLAGMHVCEGRGDSEEAGRRQQWRNRSQGEVSTAGQAHQADHQDWLHRYVHTTLQWYGMVWYAIITKVSNALNTLVSGEKPGFQALSKGLIVLLCAEVGVPDHGAVHSECWASNSG